MKTVYLVRHGESLINIHTGVYQGPDAPLTEKGKEQAEFIARRVAKLGAEALITSTHARALETAAYVAEATGLAPVRSDLFVERMSPSSYIGRSWDDTEMQHEEHEWVNTFFTENVRILDGENFADMKARAKQALQLLELREESRIIVVTHGFFLRMLVLYVIFGDELHATEFQKFAESTRTNNTGVTVLNHGLVEPVRFDRGPHSGWVLRVWNDHAHLS